MCTHRVVSYADVARQYRNHCLNTMEEMSEVNYGRRMEGTKQRMDRPDQRRDGDLEQRIPSEINVPNRTAAINDSNSGSSHMEVAASGSMDGKVDEDLATSQPMVVSSPLSPRSSKASRRLATNSSGLRNSHRPSRSRNYNQDQESDSATSMSTESMASRQSMMSQSSSVSSSE